MWDAIGMNGKMGSLETETAVMIQAGGERWSWYRSSDRIETETETQTEMICDGHGYGIAGTMTVEQCEWTGTGRRKREQV